MKNECKYRFNEDTNKWDVFYMGFDYTTFRLQPNWKLVKSFDTQNEAVKCADDCLDFSDNAEDASGFSEMSKFKDGLQDEISKIL